MFIPRHPVVENQFCSYAASDISTGVGGVVCYAGSVVYLDQAATNQEPIVIKMDEAADPFGFAMQKVKTGYHQVHPTGFMMPGDLGSSDVIAQPTYDANGAIDGTKEAPMGVAHLGIWDTVHYTTKMTATVVDAAIVPGMPLYASKDEAKVTASLLDETAAEGGAVAAAAATTQVAVVVKGVSLAKAQANINNTTLYPIRMKILV